MDKKYLDRKTETSDCTLEEYKYIYPRLMKNFVKGYEDFSELSFIEREIENHLANIEVDKNAMITISDFNYRRKHFDPIEINCGQEKFLESMSYFEKSIVSHKAIINYLENKKLEFVSAQQLEKNIIEILIGSLANKNIFKEQLIKNQKIKERDSFVSKKEFYTLCDSEIQDLKQQINDKYFKRMNDLHFAMNLNEQKGESTDHIQLQIDNNDVNKTSLNLLHLTSKYTGNLYLGDVEFMETTINEIRFISDTEKDQIFNEMVFNKGLYYFSDNHKDRIKKRYLNLENNFETKEEFVKAVNSLLHENGLHFYSRLRTLTNENEFIEYIISQYNFYNEHTPSNNLNWLSFTKKAIMYGFGILRIDYDSLKASFMKWYDKELKTLNSTEPKAKEVNIYDKIIKELVLIECLFYSQTIYTAEQISWSQMEKGRYCNELYINAEENLFEISKYKNYYTERIDKHNSVLLINEIQNIYDKALSIYNFFKAELKDHKDKKEIYVGNDGRNQIIESTVLFVIRQFTLKIALYKCDIEGHLFKKFTLSAITKKRKNETLVNFCVQLLEFIDLTGVLEQPQQTEKIKTDEVKKVLHNHIFKDNAFEVWESMFNEFGINESSRTDVKFMFEEMKKEGLIHNTVNQTTFLDWITLSYDGLIVQKTSNHSRSNSRLQAYSRAKELYKK